MKRNLRGHNKEVLQLAFKEENTKAEEASNVKADAITAALNPPDEIVGMIYESIDYDKFTIIKGNRPLNRVQCAKLIESMTNKVLNTPILVNKDFGIVDGQHRYTVRKELGLPIRYYMEEDYGIDEMKICNMIGSNWNKQDFLNMYVENENETYEYIAAMLKDYDINITILIKLFAAFQYKPATIIAKEFEEGSITLDKISEIEEFLTALKDFGSIEFKCYTTDLFVQSFLSLWKYEGYKHEILQKKLKSNAQLFERKRTRDDYILLLCSIYNSRLATKSKFYYDPYRKAFYNEEV